MGLEKAIESGKDHRKPYRGSKRFAWSCRNNNDYPWCESNRLHSSKCHEMAAKEIEDTFYDNFKSKIENCKELL